MYKVVNKKRLLANRFYNLFLGMTERILRDQDERIYQPRIHSTQIRELYVLKEETGLPMTFLVSLAIGNLIQQMQDQNWEGKKCWCGENVVCRAITSRGIEYLCNAHNKAISANGGTKFLEPFDGRFHFLEHLSDPQSLESHVLALDDSE